MKSSIVRTITLAVVLSLPASFSAAAADKDAAAGTKAVGGMKASDKKSKAHTAQAPVKVKLVDINSASKAELKTLPGIADAEADKIIAGRPYLSKANLTTHNIISRTVYEGLKHKVIAKQNKAAEAKLRELEKKEKR